MTRDRHPGETLELLRQFRKAYSEWHKLNRQRERTRRMLRHVRVGVPRERPEEADARSFVNRHLVAVKATVEESGAWGPVTHHGGAPFDPFANVFDHELFEIIDDMVERAVGFYEATSHGAGGGESGKQSSIEETSEAPTGSDVSGSRPASMVQPIHFEDFSGEQFERLVLAYHLRVEPETNWEWYGQVGSDLGRDIWGEREDGTSVCIQCVNRGVLTFDKGSGDLDKAARGPKGKPSLFRIVCRSTVSADMRDRLKKHAEGLGVATCDIWAGADFEERLRRDAEALLKRFFEGVPFPDAVDELAAFASGETAMGENATGEPQAKSATSLVCIGREVLAEGQRVAANGNRWTLRIDRFLVGNSSALCRFGDDIESVPVDQRFVLLADGDETDARSIAELAWRKDSGGIEVEVQVAPPVPSGTVRGLRSSNFHGEVEGVEAAAVLLQSILGTAWGWLDTRFGTLVGEWLRNPTLKALLAPLIRLDIVRLSSIPSLSDGTEERPPLGFVKKVVSVTPKLDEAVEDAVLVELDLELAGGGPWSGTILVATKPFDPDEHQKVLDELLAEAGRP